VKSGIIAGLVGATAIALLVHPGDALSASCKYFLKSVSKQQGSAEVSIEGNLFRIDFFRATPNSLYTIWTDHRNRATGELAKDYPQNKDALPRGVAPTFASIAGVTSGMRLDPNGVITDRYGNASLTLILDYELLRSGDSPVVGAGLAMQVLKSPSTKDHATRLNRVGGGWLRVYQSSDTASLQKTNPKTKLPVLERSTAQGMTVVVHPDFVTHGHTPGVGDVDHFPAFNGDFPFWCRVASEYEDDDDDEEEEKDD